MPRPRFTPALLAPRHWPAWLGVGLIKLLAKLPYPLLMWLGRRIGGLAMRIDSARRPIARANIALCFPELSADQQTRWLTPICAISA